MVWRCPARPEGKTLPGGRTRQTITDRRNRYNFILIATLFEQSGLISISSPVAGISTLVLGAPSGRRAPHTHREEVRWPIFQSPDRIQPDSGRSITRSST